MMYAGKEDRMNLDYYRNFIAIVEAGSISQAARELSLAQPALSNQLKILQEHYNAKLLDIKRGGRNMELTEAGRVFLQKARNIVAEEKAAAKEIADCSAGYSGSLHISLSPSMSIWFIQRYLTRFARKYPKVNFELHEVTTEAQTEQLLSGRTELAVSNAPLRQEFRFETIYRKQERLMAFFHEQSLYLHNSHPNMLLDDFDGLPVCLSRGCADLFLAACSDSGIRPQILSISTTKLSAIAWAREDTGVAVVPSELEDLVQEGMVRKVIMDERLYMEKTLSIVKGRKLSKVAELFLDFFNREV